MSDENKQELKACPCCKSDNVGMVRNNNIFRGQTYSDRYPKNVANQNHGFRVACGNCGLKTCWWHYELESLESWNTRLSGAEVKRLKSNLRTERDHSVDSVCKIGELEAEVDKLEVQLSIANQAILDMNVKMAEWIETLKGTGGTQC